MTWTPRQSDIDWTHNLINMVKDGGVWAVPMNGNIYRFNKVTRTVSMVQGEADDLHQRFLVCLKALGWQFSGGE